MSGKELYIILPALNEEDTIGKVIDEIPTDCIYPAVYITDMMDKLNQGLE